MKWKQRMSELGLTEETSSHGIRAKIKDYYSIAKTIDELNEALGDDDLSDEDKENFEADLEDLKENLVNQDRLIIKALEDYDKNKERYSKAAQNLKPKTKKTAEVTVNQQPAQAKPQSTPAPEPVKAEVVEPEKKKSGYGWLVFAVLAGVVTLGAVNVLRNRD